MAFFDKFYRLYYWIFNIPYFSVIILNDNEKIKTVIQKVTEGKKGKSIAIIDRKLKKAWAKKENRCYRDGKKFIMHVKLENAIPMIEDTQLLSTGDIIIKETNKKQLKNDIKEVLGLPIKFIEQDYFSSRMLFDLLDAFFLQQALMKPPSTWEEKKWTIIGVAICIVIIIYLVLSSGVLNPQIVGV